MQDDTSRMQRIADNTWRRQGDWVYEVFQHKIRKLRLPGWNVTRQLFGSQPEFFSPVCLYSSFNKARMACILGLSKAYSESLTEAHRQSLVVVFHKTLDLTEDDVEVYTHPDHVK